MFGLSCCLNQRKRDAKKSNPSSRLMMLCREFFSSHEMSTLCSGEVQGNLIFPRNYFLIFSCNVEYLCHLKHFERSQTETAILFHTMLTRVGQLFCLLSVNIFACFSSALFRLTNCWIPIQLTMYTVVRCWTVFFPVYWEWFITALNEKNVLLSIF